MEQLRRLISAVVFGYVIQSCSYEEELIAPSIEQIEDDYYWYYNPQLFYTIDSCYFVGELRSENDDSVYHLNYKYKIYNDTVFVIKKRIAGTHNIFYGNIFINDKPYLICSKLQ